MFRCYRWYLLPRRWLNGSSTDGIYMGAGGPRVGVHSTYISDIYPLLYFLPQKLSLTSGWSNTIQLTKMFPGSTWSVSTLSIASEYGCCTFDPSVTALICLKTSFQPSGKLGNELPLMYITSALLGPAEPHMTNGVPWQTPSQQRRKSIPPSGLWTGMLLN